MINDIDRISFADSDQFDEDSVNSWLSDSEDQINNWRGWKKAYNSLNKNQDKRLNQPLNLLQQAAKVVAAIQPGFDLTERGVPFPEELIKLIAFYSFPSCEEELRLYSCLGCGNIDEFIRGENLYKTKAVRECLQIGFHLSAKVCRRPQAQDPTTDLPIQYDQGFNYAQFVNPTGETNINKHLGINQPTLFKVGITFDRGRITSCHCSCYQEFVDPAWCSHVVAVCLYRIHEAKSVEIRAPISESLAKLSKEDLQKFSQFLISKMNPADILPVAQGILDALLASSNNPLKSLRGAPDLTAGASSEDNPNWYFDPVVIQENISKILQKFCVPKPVVYGDPRHLSNNQPQVAQEYQNILQPMRGKEPEGIWNLLSIIRDMFRREDNNALSLLRILSNCLLESKPIIMWWYCIRLNQDWCLKVLSQSNNTTVLHSQYASAYFCDEMVELWRIAALKYTLPSCQFLSARRLQTSHPNSTSSESTHELKDLVLEIARLHRSVIKVALLCLDKHQTPMPGRNNSHSNNNNPFGSNNNGNNIRSNTSTNNNLQCSHLTLMTEEAQKLFIGFRPALEACRISMELSKPIHSNNQSKFTIISTSNEMLDHLNDCNLSNADITNNYMDLYDDILTSQAPPPQPSTQPAASSSSIPIISIKSLIEASCTRKFKKSDLKFAQCEALHYYGYPNESGLVAYELADHMLEKRPALFEKMYREARTSLFESYQKLSEASNINSNGSNWNNNVNSNNVSNKSTNSMFKGSRRYRGSQQNSNLIFHPTVQFPFTSIYQFPPNSKLATNSNSLSSNNFLDYQLTIMTMMIDVEQNYQAKILLKKMQFLFNCLVNDSIDLSRIPLLHRSLFPTRNRLMEVAFHILICALQLPRPPAPLKHLEVATIRLELDLVNQAQQICWNRFVPDYRNCLIRIAQQLRDKSLPYLTEVHIPYNLGSFIFEQLTGISTASTPPPPPSSSDMHGCLNLGVLDGQDTGNSNVNGLSRSMRQQRNLSRGYNSRSRLSYTDTSNDYLSGAVNPSQYIPDQAYPHNLGHYPHHLFYPYSNRHHHHQQQQPHHHHHLHHPYQIHTNDSSIATSINMAFEAALSVLSMKTKVTEQINPLLVEGQRRLRDAFAAFLLNVHKDDVDKLTLIMKQLLDPCLNPHYKAAPLNFYLTSPLHKMIEPLDTNNEESGTSNQSDLVAHHILSTNDQSIPSPSLSTSITPVITTTPIVTTKTTQSPDKTVCKEDNLSQDTLISPSNQQTTNQIINQESTNNKSSDVNAASQGSSIVSNKYLSKSSSNSNRSDKVNSSIDTDSSALEDDTSEASASERKWEQKLRCLTTNNKRITTTTNLHSTGMAAIDSSAPETTESSDNSPTTIRKRTNLILNQQDSIINNNTANNNKNVLYTITLNGEPCGAEKEEIAPKESDKTEIERRRSSSDWSDQLNQTPNQTEETTSANQNLGPIKIEESRDVEEDGDGDDEEDEEHLQHKLDPLPLTNMDETSGIVATMSGMSFKDQEINITEVVTESLAHHMFELAQTVLQKAGLPDDSSTTVFRVSHFNANNGPETQNSSSNTNSNTTAGPAQRNLQLSAFQLGVYALGLYNQLNPLWQSRTYSSHVSWISIQLVESTTSNHSHSSLSGAGAACVLLHSWRHHLTPSEVAEIAFRVASQRRTRENPPNTGSSSGPNMSSNSSSSNSNSNTVMGMGRVGAELCLAVLAESSALSPNQIVRGLRQCGDQSPELLERGLLCVERGAYNSLSGVQPVIYFHLAQAWFQLYKSYQQQNGENIQGIHNSNSSRNSNNSTSVNNNSIASPRQQSSRTPNHTEYLQRSFNSAMKAIHILFELNTTTTSSSTNSNGSAGTNTSTNTTSSTTSATASAGPDFGRCDSSSSGFSAGLSPAPTASNGILGSTNIGVTNTTNGLDCSSTQQSSHDNNIRWTLKIAKLIGEEEVNRYCFVVLQYLQSPFLMKEIILEVMEFLQIDVTNYSNQYTYLAVIASAAQQQQQQQQQQALLAAAAVAHHYPNSPANSTQSLSHTLVTQQSYTTTATPPTYMQQQYITPTPPSHYVRQQYHPSSYLYQASATLLPNNGPPNHITGPPPGSLYTPSPTNIYHTPSYSPYHHHHHHHHNQYNVAPHHVMLPPNSITQTAQQPPPPPTVNGHAHTQVSSQSTQLSCQLNPTLDTNNIQHSAYLLTNNNSNTGIELVLKMINRLHVLFRRLIERRLQQTGQGTRDWDSLVELILEAYRAQRLLPATDLNLSWVEILQKIKSNRKCTKDLWARICTGLQTADQL